MDGQIDKILDVNLYEEMRDSYIDYAMSVIVSRALPDVRDGLKPVHRRILHAMNELNLDPSKPHKKSARIVGDTMGKYHPHGDSSIYDAMVRMAQDFTIRYPLVDGHGNFGSLDGDGAAASRYTEARLSKIAMEMLVDIDKDTVDFIPNYEGDFKEPMVLPSRFPNLLVNGSSGIAVGMATNIPPHNLREVANAIILMLNNLIEQKRETEIDEIIPIISGPDFPTGGIILGTSGISQAYKTGRGRITVRSKTEIQPMPNAPNREMIVVTEIPYQTNKARLVEKMADLVKDRKVDGITDIRDESNRNGVRVVIELRKDVNANVILNKLYKFSPLQEAYSIIMLALVGTDAKVLNIKQALAHYVSHQKNVIVRRTRFDLNKAKKRAHILEGYLTALDHIDEVLNIIRSSKDTGEAKSRLSEAFGLSEEQTSAIVDMRFRSLTGLEREKIDKEFAEIQTLMQELSKILEDEDRLYEVIRDELVILSDKYGDDRRTQIVIDPGDIDIDDLIDEEDSVVTVTCLDYVKRLPLSTYRSQHRGGKGIIGMQTRDEDLIKYIFVANTHDMLLFFTNYGRVYSMKAYEIPVAGRAARGVAIVNLLNLSGGEKTTAVISVRDGNYDGSLMFLTKFGMVKKISLDLFAKIKKNGLIVAKVKNEDELVSVLRVYDGQELFIASSQGMGIRFSELNIRQTGRGAMGVKGIRLNSGDFVVSAGVLSENDCLLFVSANGYGKCSPFSEFRLQSRYGKGLHVYKVTEKTGPVVGVDSVNDKEELILINSEGIIIRIRIADINLQGRYTQGVKLIDLNDGVTVAGMAKIAVDQLDEPDGETSGENLGDTEDVTER
ncbi:MAG: DNA gyrase subunit A [Clostridiales bacterium]|jgi:DNA gyrase subunit A|nr:DNA gyrase subunit A [Clostridiales bacterium]